MPAVSPFLLQRPSRVLSAQTCGSTEPKIFTVWPSAVGRKGPVSQCMTLCHSHKPWYRRTACWERTAVPARGRWLLSHGAEMRCHVLGAALIRPKTVMYTNATLENKTHHQPVVTQGQLTNNKGSGASLKQWFRYKIINLSCKLLRGHNSSYSLKSAYSLNVVLYF